MIFDLTFIKECFDFDFQNGTIFWKSDRPLNHFSNWRGRTNWLNKNKGKLAGSLSVLGYPIVKLTIDGKEFNIPQHRLIYAMYHEDKEPPLIDHADGNTLNNSISNLKPSDKEFNSKNRYMSKLNTTGITGVCRVKDRPNMWRASIKIEGQVLTKTTGDFFEACCFRKSLELRGGFSERHGREIPKS